MSVSPSRWSIWLNRPANSEECWRGARGGVGGACTSKGTGTTAKADVLRHHNLSSDDIRTSGHLTNKTTTTNENVRKAALFYEPRIATPSSYVSSRMPSSIIADHQGKEYEEPQISVHHEPTLDFTSTVSRISLVSRASSLSISVPTPFYC